MKITTTHAEIVSSGAVDSARKNIHLRDMKGIVPVPEMPVSVEDMKKTVKDRANQKSRSL